MGTTKIYTEADLIQNLKLRDDRAFGYLYDNYSGALYSVILQIVQDSDLANDVLQEVFVNIWRKIDSYDDSKSRLYTWLVYIARHASIDLIRSRSYRNNAKNQSLNDDAHVSSVPGQVVQQHVDGIGLRKVMLNLKEEHRALLELSYFKGFTHEEIAVMESLPVGTVKTRIRSALKQLRDILK